MNKCDCGCVDFYQSLISQNTTHFYPIVIRCLQCTRFLDYEERPHKICDRCHEKNQRKLHAQYPTEFPEVEELFTCNDCDRKLRQCAITELRDLTLCFECLFYRKESEAECSSCGFILERKDLCEGMCGTCHRLRDEALAAGKPDVLPGCSDCNFVGWNLVLFDGRCVACSCMKKLRENRLEELEQLKHQKRAEEKRPRRLLSRKKMLYTRREIRKGESFCVHHRLFFKGELWKGCRECKRHERAQERNRRERAEWDRRERSK